MNIKTLQGATASQKDTGTPEHQVRRSGVASSEFWMVLATSLFAAVAPVLSDAVAELVAKSPWAIFAPVIPVAGYAIGRSLIKVSRNMASAAASSSAMPSTVAAAGDVVLGDAPQSKEPETYTPGTVGALRQEWEKEQAEKTQGLQYLGRPHHLVETEGMPLPPGYPSSWGDTSGMGLSHATGQEEWMAGRLPVGDGDGDWDAENLNLVEVQTYER